MNNQNNPEQVILGLKKDTELATLEPLMTAVKDSVVTINKLNKTFEEFVDPKIKEEREAVAKAKKEAAAIKNAEYQAKFREKQAAEQQKEREELLARLAAAETRLKEAEAAALNSELDQKVLADIQEMERKLAQAEAIAEVHAAEASELADRLSNISNTAQQEAEKLLLAEREASAKRINDLEEALKVTKSQEMAPNIAVEKRSWGWIGVAGALFFLIGWIGRGLIS